MAKNYFPHDYHARSELRDLRMKFGMEGYGFYWAFVEILHESGGVIRLKDLNAVAYDLKMNINTCEKIIKESGLFVIKKGKITSNRVLRNIRKMEELSDTRRTAAETRWHGEESDIDVNEPEIENEHKSGFLLLYEGLTYAETLRNLKEWFINRMDQLEDEAGDDSAIWQVRGYVENVLDYICECTRISVAGRKLLTVDYLGTISYYFQGNENLEALGRIIADVNSRAVKGGIRNKKNYLISALYQGVKTEGG